MRSLERATDAAVDSGNVGNVVKLGYRPELDGVRAVAITVVVLGHAYGWPDAFGLGVQIFFVLSGFLITTLLLEEHRRHGRISLRGFYRRRALRLLPALSLVLAAYAVFFARDVAEAAKGAVAGLSYSANIWLAVDPQSFPFGLSHLWSLAMEEQFYTVWPLALVVCLAFGVRRRLVVAGLVGLFVAVTVARVLVIVGDSTPGVRGGAPDMQAGGLAVGCLLAMWFATGRARLPRYVGGASIAAVALALIGDRLTYTLGAFHVVAALALAAVLTGGRTARLLRTPPLVFVGRISYGLYLWHALLVWGAPWPNTVAVGVSVVVAWLSFRYVETPFLRRKEAGKRHSETGGAPRPLPVASR